MTYNPDRAITYAHKWAYKRNPRYYDFSELGGDCTNFISQSLYAGCGVMNYEPIMGWYYNSVSSRSPSWTGVEFLYNFLTTNMGPGPFGHEAPIFEARPGDVIQLSFDGESFTHSLLVVACDILPAPDNILIATHTLNSDNRKLSTYRYKIHRLISIEGARRK